jgi:hypothetical protein
LLACASCFWLSVLKGMGATRAGTEPHARQRVRSQTAAKAAQCFAAKKNGARQKPSPGRQAKAKASSGERRGFARIYMRSSPLTPLSFGLLCSYLPPAAAPPDSPPCLLLPSSHLPCKRTNSKKSSAFKSARRSFSFVALAALVRSVESTKIEVALSDRSTGSDAEHGLFATEAYRTPRCVAPTNDDRLNPRPPRWCPFFFALYVVVDELLVQRTGLQRRKRKRHAPRRPDTSYCLGIGLSLACTRAPRASRTGRRVSETGPQVCRVPTAIALLKDKWNRKKNYIFLVQVLCPCRPWGGSGVVPARVLSGSSPAPLGSN